MTQKTNSAELTLAFDTSGQYCAAALMRADTLLGAVCEPMKRGQSERLMELMEELLTTHDVRWQELSRIGVGVGPGNFTGIRIAVSAARGLALSLGAPAVGVSTFEATLLGKPAGSVALVAAPREQVYVQQAGQEVRLDAAADWQDLAEAYMPPAPDVLVENIARVTAHAPATAPAPTPLYIKPADAAPASDPPPVILDDA